MSNSNKTDSINQHGGTRAGSGRPKGSGKYGEPTKAIRVPEGSVSYIEDFLANQYTKTSSSKKPSKSQSNHEKVIAFGSPIQSLEESKKQNFPLFSSKVAAGLPSYANDDLDDSIDLNDYLVQKPQSTFMLKVQGMSMRDAGILPDDILIVDRSKQPTHNKIVIAAIDGELTVKRLFKRGERIKLLPDNPDYPEIDIKNEAHLIIWGVVVGSFRRFESTKFS